MAAHLSGDCTLEDLSDQTAQLALQGPGAEALLRTLTAVSYTHLDVYKRQGALQRAQLRHRQQPALDCEISRKKSPAL